MSENSALFMARLGLELPIVQAPMAGTSTPAMAAAVANVGGLGSLGFGAEDAAGAERMLREAAALTPRGVHVNLFCHAPAVADDAKAAAWLRLLAPEFAAQQAAPPAALREIYRSFLTDPDMLRLLLAAKPRAVSFHFGLPPAATIAALRGAGIFLMGSATSPAEGQAVQAAGLDAVIAQGYEAGGHRGVFDPAAADDRIGTLALARLLVRRLTIPVVAAGGLMDGAGIAAVLRLGAAAAQLGTAFVGCPESAADAGYRAALQSEAALHTVMTRAISGRPARCLANRFTALGLDAGDAAVPSYPLAYDAGKALHAAAKAKGEFGYGAQWAGQGAPLARMLPAAELVRCLAAEM